MGGLVSRAVDQNMKKNQEFMVEINRITVMISIALCTILSHLLHTFEFCAVREANPDAEPDEGKNVSLL